MLRHMFETELKPAMCEAAEALRERETAEAHERLTTSMLYFLEDYTVETGQTAKSAKQTLIRNIYNYFY